MAEQINGLLERRRRYAAGRNHFLTRERQAALLRDFGNHEERGIDVPVDDLRTITTSRPALSGQLPEAFWIRCATPSRSPSDSTVRSAPKDLRAHIADIAASQDALVCAYPNARPAQRVRPV